MLKDKLFHKSEKHEAGNAPADVEATRPASEDTLRAQNARDDPEMQGLSLYEKKALLVNRELASQGMGKYQWMVFGLCGMGYFLDLLWAQAFGLIVSRLEKEFGVGDANLGNLSTAFSAGLTAGAAFWGIITDIIGRYYAFNLTVLISAIFGICLGAPDSYNGVVIIAAFLGLGIGGNIPIDTTICLELLPQNKRWLLPTLSLFQPFGVIVCSALAYALIPAHSCAENLSACSLVAAGEACCTKSSNYGWRYLVFTLGGITIFVFIARFVLFRFKESPKFLLYRGQDEKAVEVLQYIAKYNKVDCHITLQSFTALTDDNSSINSTGSEKKGRIVLGSGDKQQNLSMWKKFKLELIRLNVLFGTPIMAWLTICIWLIYAFDYWAFTISGTYLPTIIERKGRDVGATTGNIYKSYIYIYLFGIPGVIFGSLIYGWRQISMIISSLLFGGMLFAFTAVSDQASYIGISGLSYCFQSMFNSILYGATPEFFPAPVRATASGVSSFWGRIFSIIAPIAGAQVLAADPSGNSTMYLAGGGAFVCTVFICLLPRRYIGGQSY